MKIIALLTTLVPFFGFGIIEIDEGPSNFNVWFSEQDSSIQEGQSIVKLSLNHENSTIWIRSGDIGSFTEWEIWVEKAGKKVIDTLPAAEYEFKLIKENYEIIYGHASLLSQHYVEISARFYEEQEMEIMDLKPAIYIYSDEPKDFELSVEPAGEFTFTYPNHKAGWKVHVDKDGLWCDGKPMDYLFWEGVQKQLDFNYIHGFVFKGEETVEFLEKQLTSMGLNDREKQDFIAFWGPKLVSNDYNYVHFIMDEDYDKEVGSMNTSIEIESTLKLYMAYQALPAFVPTIEQTFEPFKRKGLTLVEWGGGEVIKQQIGL